MRSACPIQGIFKPRPQAVPAWRYQLWPNASHAWPAEVPDEVNACIRQFVLEDSNGGQSSEGAIE
jgi:hypothetical protein